MSWIMPPPPAPQRPGSAGYASSYSWRLKKSYKPIIITTKEKVIYLAMLFRLRNLAGVDVSWLLITRWFWILFTLLLLFLLTKWREFTEFPPRWALLWTLLLNTERFELRAHNWLAAVRNRERRRMCPGVVIITLSILTFAYFSNTQYTSNSQ